VVSSLCTLAFQNLLLPGRPSVTALAMQVQLRCLEKDALPLARALLESGSSELGVELLQHLLLVAAQHHLLPEAGAWGSLGPALQQPEQQQQAARLVLVLGGSQAAQPGHTSVRSMDVLHQARAAALSLIGRHAPGHLGSLMRRFRGLEVRRPRAQPSGCRDASSQG
jgi:hypothetical protein